MKYKDAESTDCDKNHSLKALPQNPKTPTNEKNIYNVLKVCYFDI